MSWLKLGRWLLVGVVVAGGASACGGRGNLPGGEASGGDSSDEQPFGGAQPGGGAPGSAGSHLVAGRSFGGAPVGGAISLGGVANIAGAPNVCKPGFTMCENNVLETCTGPANGYIYKDCGPTMRCVQNGMKAACLPIQCTPGKLLCDATGRFAQVCAPDGLSALTKLDCVAQGQRCQDGNCSCALGTADCDGNVKTGCETKVSSDPKNCTGCGFACSTNNVPSPTCDNGCTGKCASGFQDCNGEKLKDGCETNVGTDVKNCGGCALACSNNHVTASCTGSVCDGACSANFADCNGSKLKDGCESDSRIDLKNCGACGVACSTSHLKPTCSAGACGGTCEVGFDDCNGNKQTDGCETNTLNDAKNCGACGKVCSGGDTCSAGVCSALLTFTGVAQALAPQSLTGWSLCYSEPYGQNGTSMDTIRKACTGSLLMMACRPVGTEALQVAAYAPRADVLFDTGEGDIPHVANGVGWYFNGSQSWGFAPAGDIITRDSCDTQDSSIDLMGADGKLRLCWHTGDNYIQGGWRCGRDDNLNISYAFERLLFQAQ